MWTATICPLMRGVRNIDDLAKAIDIHNWAERTHGSRSLSHPCPRPYCDHARATLDGRHVCIVLTPSQEIKVFADGTLAFAFSVSPQFRQRGAGFLARDQW